MRGGQRQAGGTRCVSQQAPRRLLMIRFGSLGDIAHTLPALDCLRRSFPAAEIAYAVDGRFADLLERHPQIDRTIAIDRQQLVASLRNGNLREACRLVDNLRKGLRGGRFDLLLDFQADLKSAVVSLAARARTRFCFTKDLAKEGNHLTGDVLVDPGPPTTNKVDRYLAMAGAAGARTEHPRPCLGRVPEAELRVARQLAAAGLDRAPFAVVHPGVSPRGAIKRWPAERFAVVADHLRREWGYGVLLTWAGASERATCEAVRSAARADLTIMDEPWPLKELVAALRRAALLVSVDSGPLHVASVLGVPHVQIMGPKDPRVYGTRFGIARTVVREVDCFPCSHRQCPVRPVERLCLEETTPDLVNAAVDAVLHEVEVGAGP